MDNFLIKAFLGTILSILTGLFPTWFSSQAELGISAPSEIVMQAPQAVKPVTALAAVPKAVKEVFRAGPMLLCRFTGKAYLQGQPVSNASLALWVTSPRGYEIRRFRTGADGTYDVRMTVNAVYHEPVDWEIRGQTTDLKTVQLSGRHIVVRGESTFPIENTLEFIAG